MSKHYFSKSVFALTVLTATATSGLAVQAEDIVTTPSSTSTKVESTTPTSTIAEEKSNVTSTPTAITDASTATSTNTTTNNQNPQKPQLVISNLLKVKKLTFASCQPQTYTPI